MIVFNVCFSILSTLAKLHKYFNFLPICQNEQNQISFEYFSNCQVESQKVSLNSPTCCPPLTHNAPAAWRSGGFHKTSCGVLPCKFALLFPRGYCRHYAKPPVRGSAFYNLTIHCVPVSVLKLYKTK